MPPYPLTNFEIEKYYQNKPKFNGVYSRNNLPKIKHGANIIYTNSMNIIWIWISYICYKTLLPFNICNKCGSEDEQIFMEERSFKIL